MLGFELSKNYEDSLESKFKIYTPNEIARKMCAISFRKYFKGKNREEALDNISIIDLSCGTGNFLVIALNFLIRMSKRIYGEYQFNSSWISGYDIDSKATEIAIERMDFICKQYGIVNASFDINTENSLLKTFDKKYSIILGNPPYIGEKNNREIFTEIIESDFGKKHKEGKMDYLYFFIEKGIEILEDKGILTYITTNYWLKADYAKKLRAYIQEEGRFFYVEDINKSVFKKALGQHNMIFTIIKGNNENLLYVKEKKSYISDNSLIFAENGKIVLAEKEHLQFFKNYLKKSNYFLGELLNINQGVVSGCDKAFVYDEYREEYSNYLKAFYKSSDINGYSLNLDNRYWILYLDRDSKIDDSLEKELEEYKERLFKRREAKNGRIEWYQLQWSRKKEIFTQEKIVGKQRGAKSLFSYSDGEFFGSADIYYLSVKNRETNLFYILGYLNSSSFFEWFYYNGKRKGEDLELYATPLKETPIYYPEDKNKIEYIEKLVKKQIENYSEEVQSKINLFFKEEL